MICVELMNIFVQTKESLKDDGRLLLKYLNMNKAMASLFISSKGEINSSLKRGPVCSLKFEKVMILIIFLCSLLICSSLVVCISFFPDNVTMRYG